MCDLTAAFALTGPTISRHLKVLCEAGLIDCERRGTWVYYWVIPVRLADLSQLLDVGSMAPA
jgi:ArsR family transcriptional regulator, arsenate/arsenite/antimonite-responsive transcriptional repressor